MNMSARRFNAGVINRNSATDYGKSLALTNHNLIAHKSNRPHRCPRETKGRRRRRHQRIDCDRADRDFNTILQLQIIRRRDHKSAAHIHLRILTKEHAVRIQKKQIRVIDRRAQHPVDIRRIIAGDPADHIINIRVRCGVRGKGRASARFDVKLAKAVKQILPDQRTQILTDHHIRRN